MKNLILPNSFSSMSIFDDFFNFSDFGFKNGPSVNVKEDKNQFLIEVAAPGYKKDSFNLEIKNGYLKISSKNEALKEEKEEKYYRKEFSYSSFERSFSLPDNVNSDDIKASYDNGILNISIPKKLKIEKSAKLIEVQ